MFKIILISALAFTLQASSVLAESDILSPRPNRPGYKARLGSIKTNIVVGAYDENDSELGSSEFEPSVRASFHDGEAHITIHHIGSPKTANIETNTDGTIRHAANGYNHEFVTMEGNKLKWDMIFNEPIEAPNLIFRIKHSPNLAFYKQVLTAQDIAEGRQYRYPEAKGSYAVYFKDGRRDGKWQTGKVAQIDSMYFVDSVGAKSPLLNMQLVDVEVGVKRLIVNMPTLWLNGPARVYPIRLDPVLGYDTNGALSLPFSGLSYWMAAHKSDSSGGRLKSFKCWSDVSDGYVFMGIAKGSQTTPYYVDGYPVLDQNQGGGTPLNAVYTLNANNIIIEPNTWYRLGIATSTPAWRIAYDAIVYKLEYYTFAGAGNELVSPVPTTTKPASSNGYMSLWAEYEHISPMTHLGYPQMVF